MKWIGVSFTIHNVRECKSFQLDWGESWWKRRHMWNRIENYTGQTERNEECIQTIIENSKLRQPTQKLCSHVKNRNILSCKRTHAREEEMKRSVHNTHSHVTRVQCRWLMTLIKCIWSVGCIVIFFNFFFVCVVVANSLDFRMVLLPVLWRIEIYFTKWNPRLWQFAMPGKLQTPTDYIFFFACT